MRSMPRRIDAVEAGADHGHGTALALQPALVRRAVDAMGKAGDDSPALPAQMGREVARIV